MIPLAFALAFGATICWGLAQIIGKIASRSVEVPVLNAVRTSFASALLLAYLLSTEGLNYFGAELTLLAAFTGVIAWFAAAMLFFYLMQREAAHRIAPISNTQPLWGVLAAVLLLGEEARSTIFLSVALVILGSYFLVPKGGPSKSRLWNPKLLLALLVGVMWGGTIALNKYCLSGGMSPAMFLLVGVVSASAACNIAMFAHRAKKKVNFNGRGVSFSILSGIIGLFVGQILWQHALKIEEASALSPVVGVVAPLAFLFSILFLGERPTKRAILGIIIVFTGILLVTM